MTLARSKETPAAARVAAWREVLDRGAGKPHQALTIDQPREVPKVVSFIIRKQPDSDNRT